VVTTAELVALAALPAGVVAKVEDLARSSGGIACEEMLGYVYYLSEPRRGRSGGREGGRSG
jgi:hypothetical protein